MNLNKNYFSIRNTYTQKRVSPSLQIPINYYTIGVSGIDKNDFLYSGTLESTENRYHVSKWSTNPLGSVLLLDGDIFTISIVTGTHLSPDKGTVSFWYSPNVDLDSLSDICSLIDMDSFLKIQIDTNGKLQCYNYISPGDPIFTEYSDLTDITSGTWLFLAYSYDCASGTSLFINGDLVTQQNIAWEAPVMGNLLEIGCISGTVENAGNGYFDDICLFNKRLCLGEIVVRYHENHDND
jgi:hypothetical protein